MLSLYEILKASKTGIAPDMWTALAGANFGGAGSGAEVKELTGIPPLSFTADGTPLLDYLISGNMEQSGTPTLTNPIQPQETGDRTGNLFDKNATDITNGYAIDYYLLITGETSQYQAWRISEYIPVSSNVNYYLKWDSRESVAATTPSICFYSSTKSYIGGINYNNRTGLTFTTPNNTAYIRFSFIQSQVDYIMLNTGSTALPYEPYGYKIPISSANTTTPVHLGEVETTRKIKKLVLDGVNDGEWKKSFTRTGSFYLNVGVNAITSLGLCDRAVNVSAISQYDSIGKMFVESIGSPKLINLWLFNTNISLDDFKSYLQQQYAAGTPVCVWYVLATPETGIVNEPLRKIGDYADTLSMEQAGVSIPTLHGNTVIDVMTELKPSEMYIKYQE